MKKSLMQDRSFLEDFPKGMARHSELRDETDNLLVEVWEVIQESRQLRAESGALRQQWASLFISRPGVSSQVG